MIYCLARFARTKLKYHGFLVAVKKITELRLRCKKCNCEFVIDSEDFEEPLNIKDAVEIWNSRKGAEE